MRPWDALAGGDSDYFNTWHGRDGPVDGDPGRVDPLPPGEGEAPMNPFHYFRIYDVVRWDTVWLDN